MKNIKFTEPGCVEVVSENNSFKKSHSITDILLFSILEELKKESPIINMHVPDNLHTPILNKVETAIKSRTFCPTCTNFLKVLVEK